jgi:hypothetical protein
LIVGRFLARVGPETVTSGPGSKISDRRTKRAPRRPTLKSLKPIRRHLGPGLGAVLPPPLDVQVSILSFTLQWALWQDPLGPLSLSLVLLAFLRLVGEYLVLFWVCLFGAGLAEQLPCTLGPEPSHAVTLGPQRSLLGRRVVLLTTFQCVCCRLVSHFVVSIAFPVYWSLALLCWVSWASRYLASSRTPIVSYPPRHRLEVSTPSERRRRSFVPRRGAAESEAADLGSSPTCPIRSEPEIVDV